MRLRPVNPFHRAVSAHDDEFGQRSYRLFASALRGQVSLPGGVAFCRRSGCPFEHLRVNGASGRSRRRIVHIFPRPADCQPITRAAFTRPRIPRLSRTEGTVPMKSQDALAFLISPREIRTIILQGESGRSPCARHCLRTAV